MAHYALIDPHTMLVTQVIVGRDENDVAEGVDDWEAYYAPVGMMCRRTSYNGRIRKNFAGVGYLYDPERDAFIPPQPLPSWLLDEDTCLWQPPIPYPGGEHIWNETNGTWDPVDG